MTLTREQLYQIYEDLQNAIKVGKGKREVTFEIIENIEIIENMMPNPNLASRSNYSFL